MAVILEMMMTGWREVMAAERLDTSILESWMKGILAA
jgi:hypothetical protein